MFNVMPSVAAQLLLDQERRRQEREERQSILEMPKRAKFIGGSTINTTLSLSDCCNTNVSDYSSGYIESAYSPPYIPPKKRGREPCKACQGFGCDKCDKTGCEYE